MKLTRLLILSLAIVLAYHGSGFASGINARGTVTVVEYNGCVDDLNTAVDGWAKCADDAEKALKKAKTDIDGLKAVADAEKTDSFFKGMFTGGFGAAAIIAILMILF